MGEPRCGTRGAMLHTRMSTTLTKKGKTRLRNKYAGTCAFCGAHVPAGQGCAETNERLNRWSVFC